MKTLPRLWTTIALAAALAASLPAFDRGILPGSISQAQAQDQSGLSVETIGPLVREYLLKNPEVLEEALTALEEKRQRDELAARAEALGQNADLIFRSPTSPVAGNADGDVTLVEFFDYNCGYCKRMLPAMLDLLKTDPNLKVVFKEWPVLSDGSAEAARIGLAVSKVAPERYLDFHVALMSAQSGSGADKTLAMKVVEDLGIDAEAVTTTAQSKEVNDAIAENYLIAEALGLRGTPSYVLGDEVIPGAVSFEMLQEKIARVRDDGCRTC
ncbi:protein-disulfide isomerase [Tepidamorphus gemmatus]|uniref:Protein-disulfide isomerase n=1 Tax=Tepidamorphus gemmatus TaxID=747076 RepID=A0A4R3MCB1_9HYPH|nr:DsbA family protein [Tepidamorphus gemmatus]TCT11324.1 protein-disulfide isomerase [Tepidamorphus gemmatus]